LTPIFLDDFVLNRLNIADFYLQRGGEILGIIINFFNLFDDKVFCFHPNFFSKLKSEINSIALIVGLVRQV